MYLLGEISFNPVYSSKSKLPQGKEIIVFFPKGKHESFYLQLFSDVRGQQHHLKGRCSGALGHCCWQVPWEGRQWLISDAVLKLILISSLTSVLHTAILGVFLKYSPDQSFIFIKIIIDFSFLQTKTRYPAWYPSPLMILISAHLSLNPTLHFAAFCNQLVFL